MVSWDLESMMGRKRPTAWKENERLYIDCRRGLVRMSKNIVVIGYKTTELWKSRITP